MRKLVGYLLLSIVCKAAFSAPNREPISIHTQTSAVISTLTGNQRRERSVFIFILCIHTTVVISILLTVPTVEIWGTSFFSLCAVTMCTYSARPHANANSYALFSRCEVINSGLSVPVKRLVIPLYLSTFTEVSHGAELCSWKHNQYHPYMHSHARIFWGVNREIALKDYEKALRTPSCHLTQ